MPEFTEDLNDTANHVPPQIGATDRGERETPLALARNGKRKAAARQMVKEWDATFPEMQNHFAQWKANVARHQGLTGVTCVKEKDTKVCRVPLSASTTFAGMNKAARLARRLTAQLFADPPLPDVGPEGGTDEERDAAEFATRVLTILGDPNDLDVAGTAAAAHHRGANYGSGFRHWWVDPRGGGHRPMQILASPEATTVTDALEAPGDPIERFVAEDGVTLTDLRGEAKRRWVPRLRLEILTGKHVRFIPQQVRDIEEADGIMIGAMVPYGTVKHMFPEIPQLPAEDRLRIVMARPRHANQLIPKGKRDVTGDRITDDTFVFTLTRYHRVSPDYMHGAHLITLGEDYLAWPRQRSEDETEGDWYDHQHDAPLDLPLDQFKQLEDEDNPYGKGLIEVLGAANEIRANLLGFTLEFIEKFKRLKTFVPMHSTLQPEQLQSPMNTVISILPGGEPKTEQMPTFPRPVQDFLTFVTTDMDDESALQETAQGLAPASVTSGRQAQQIVEQVNKSLSDMHHNAGKGLVRGWRIMLQLIRAFYTVPQQIGWIGSDGVYKQRAWTGADLVSAKHIRVKRGSFTMLQPTVKTQLAFEQMQLQAMGVQEYQDVVASNVQGLIGLQDNPHRQRVRRQIDRWHHGPPEGWTPPEPVVNPETGQPEPQPDPVLGRLFETLPVDLVPEIAALRAYELGNAIAGTKFGAKPAPWRQGMLEAYQVMRQAAGILTIEEQQQAAAQQAQAEEAERQAQQEAQQRQQETKLEESRIKAETELQKTAMARPQLA